MTESTLTTRGARLAYTDDGAGANPYLFLHYWGGSSRTWEGVIADIGADARCVALDQRGWGRSEALDERYDLDAMADDVEDVVAALGLSSYILVGHSMGGKVAQIVASRGLPPLAGMVLVAPAPPGPMEVPVEQRAAMLASYGSREGVEQAISVLAGRPLSDAQRKRIVADTLAGTPGAKREWTEHGMVAVVDRRLADFTGPVRVIVGDLDRVERPGPLQKSFAEVLPQAMFETLPETGHLSPIENPSAIAWACRAIVSDIAEAAVLK